jgi:hypothetical protein
MITLEVIMQLWGRVIMQLGGWVFKQFWGGVIMRFGEGDRNTGADSHVGLT